MEDSIHRKLSVELVAILNPKIDITKSIVCKPKIAPNMKVLHPKIVFRDSIVEFGLA